MSELPRGRHIPANRSFVASTSVKYGVQKQNQIVNVNVGKPPDQDQVEVKYTILPKSEQSPYINLEPSNDLDNEVAMKHAGKCSEL